MPLTRKQKEEEVKNLTEKVKNAASAVFVNFHGLSVDEADEMRGALRDNDVSYKVVKKSLTNIALEESGTKGEKPELEGELAIAYGDDYLEPARSIYTFQKKFDDRISIMGGIYDGEYVDKAAMMEIAQIPSKETLHGMFVNVINSPVQGLVSVLSQVAKAKEA